MRAHAHWVHARAWVYSCSGALASFFLCSLLSAHH